MTGPWSFDLEAYTTRYLTGGCSWEACFSLDANAPARLHVIPRPTVSAGAAATSPVGATVTSAGPEPLPAAIAAAAGAAMAAAGGVAAAAAAAAAAAQPSEPAAGGPFEPFAVDLPAVSVREALYAFETKTGLVVDALVSREANGSLSLRAASAAAYAKPGGKPELARISLDWAGRVAQARGCPLRRAAPRCSRHLCPPPAMLAPHPSFNPLKTLTLTRRQPLNQIQTKFKTNRWSCCLTAPSARRRGRPTCPAPARATCSPRRR